MIARRISAVILIFLSGIVLAGCGGDGTKSSSSSTDGCEDVDAPSTRSETRKPPSSSLDPSKTWTAAVETSCGTFTIRLDVEQSPNTTASFASLARSGFFDDTTFHRIVPGFVIQGGDPTGTGKGGPGYSVVDSPAAGTSYTHGVVAMANSEVDPAGTARSQFFVTTADVELPPDYAVLGKVVSGLAVVDRIGQFGDANDPEGRPTRVVVVRRVTVSSS